MSRTVLQVVEPCKPKNLGNPYNIQDNLIRSVNVPSVVYEGEEFYRQWSDREYLHERWELGREIMRRGVEPTDWGPKLGGKIIVQPSPDSWCESCSTEEFIELLTALADPSLTKKFGPPVGGRIVRFTNVSNGYPCYAIDIFHSPKGMPGLRGRKLGMGEASKGIWVGHLPVVTEDMDRE